RISLCRPGRTRPHPRHHARLQSQFRLIASYWLPALLLSASSLPGGRGGRSPMPSLCVGTPRFHLAPERELTDRPLDVKFDARHFGEKIDIADADRASA